MGGGLRRVGEIRPAVRRDGGVNALPAGFRPRAEPGKIPNEPGQLRLIERRLAVQIPRPEREGRNDRKRQRHAGAEKMPEHAHGTPLCHEMTSRTHFIIQPLG